MKRINMIFLLCSSLIVFDCNSQIKNEKHIEVIDNDKGEIEAIKHGDYFENERANRLNSKALIEVKSGNLKKAEGLFLEALEIEPKNSTILNNLGLIERSKGNLNDAMGYFLKPFQYSDSTYFNAANNLGFVYVQTNKFQECVDISKYVIKSTDDNLILGVASLNTTLGYIGLMNCDKAKETFKYVQTNISELKGMKNQIQKIEMILEQCDKHQR